MVWLQPTFMNHHHHHIKQHKLRTIISRVNFRKKIQISCGKILCRLIIETTMYVSPAQAPYEGVYQRQPAGLPKAEFIPQYPPQPAYQNNGSDGQIYVPQMKEQQVCFSFYFYDLIGRYYII